MNPFPFETFEPLHPEVVVPTRATAGSVGYDVRAYVLGREIRGYVGLDPVVLRPLGEALVLDPGVRAAIPLCFRATMPVGQEAQLRLRSSIAFKRGLIMPNAPATIDPDYPDEWLLLVSNPLAVSVTIHHLERVAQIVFARVLHAEGQDSAAGRAGGLGSTGNL
jgi:dUTP pyrophosphatase